MQDELDLLSVEFQQALYDGKGKGTGDKTSVQKM